MASRLLDNDGNRALQLQLAVVVCAFDTAFPRSQICNRGREGQYVHPRVSQPVKIDRVLETCLGTAEGVLLPDHLYARRSRHLDSVRGLG